MPRLSLAYRLSKKKKKEFVSKIYNKAISRNHIDFWLPFQTLKSWQHLGCWLAGQQCLELGGGFFLAYAPGWPLFPPRLPNSPRVLIHLSRTGICALYPSSQVRFMKKKSTATSYWQHALTTRHQRSEISDRIFYWVFLEVFDHQQKSKLWCWAYYLLLWYLCCLCD